jgi:4-carboxymuconolactone decarboxylase
VRTRLLTCRPVSAVILAACLATTACTTARPSASLMEVQTMTARDRHARGLELLKRVGGENYDVQLKGLETVAPDLARFTVEFAYGDVMSRPGLDLKPRQLATVAALAAMGTAPAQLKYHINGALNVGWTPSEIVEALLLSSVYAGFPAALNGVFSAKEVFRDRGIAFTPSAAPVREDRYERGLRALERVSAGSGTAVVQSLEDIAPDLARFIVEFSYGDVIARAGLDGRTKEIATVALLTALGTARPQLKMHINAALNLGASEEEIVEVVQQMAVYAGFPAALNGVSAATEVFRERTDERRKAA